METYYVLLNLYYAEVRIMSELLEMKEHLQLGAHNCCKPPKSAIRPTAR